MTPAGIKKRVAEVKRLRGLERRDEELRLFADVLISIVGGTCIDPRECAMEALQVRMNAEKITADANLTIRIPKELLREFKELVTSRSLDVSKALRLFMEYASRHPELLDALQEQSEA